MIFFKDTGVFWVKDEKEIPALKEHFKSELYKKNNQYFIKGSEKNYNALIENFKGILDYSCYLYPLMVELKRKNLKVKTRYLYFYINLKFLKFIKKTPEEVDIEDINRYLRFLKYAGKKISTINTVKNALYFFYKNRLDKRLFNVLNIRKRKNIPKVFSREEIQKIINSVENTKHKLLLKIAYSCGLKLGEIIRIKVSDIDLGKKRLYVRDKNSKIVRYVPIQDTLVEDIKEYITGYYRDKNGLSDYLFFSEFPKKQTEKITDRTVEEIFQKAVRKAGIKGHFTFSSLRDSFVVHLLEKKFPINQLIKILGTTKAQFFNRYEFYIKATGYTEIPDLLDFGDIH